jgi:hypothetical protein
MVDVLLENITMMAAVAVVVVLLADMAVAMPKMVVVAMEVW